MIIMIIFGMIGMFAGIARLSTLKPIRCLAAVYVDFIRGTPLLVQIFLIYFAIPLVTGQRIDPFIAAITACSINSGAYVAEIFRAGIQSITRGQWEACHSLGLTRWQSYRHIILPQAIRRVIPPLTSQAVSLIKDSALVSTIAVYDLTMQGRTIIAETFLDFEIWSVVAAVYLMVTLTLSTLATRLEHRATQLA